MNKKARLTHLLDEYEKSLFNVNGIKKKGICRTNWRNNP